MDMPTPNPRILADKARIVARLRAAESHGVAWCVQPPNSAMWLPAQWTHATVNLGGAVALGLQSDETDADEEEEVGDPGSA